MRQAARDLVAGSKLAWNAWKRLGSLMAQRYWPVVVGSMALFGLLIAGMAYQHQLRYGTTPPPAMEITGEAWWEYGGPDPELVIRAHRMRFVDCAGADILRPFLYADGRQVVVVPTRSSSPNPDALTATPKVSGRGETPDDYVFWLRYVMKREDTRGLTSINWFIRAEARACEDGQARILLPLGTITIPKPEEYWAGAGSSRPPDGGPSD